MMTATCRFGGSQDGAFGLPMRELPMRELPRPRVPIDAQIGYFGGRWVGCVGLWRSPNSKLRANIPTGQIVESTLRLWVTRASQVTHGHRPRQKTGKMNTTTQTCTTTQT